MEQTVLYGAGAFFAIIFTIQLLNIGKGEVETVEKPKNKLTKKVKKEKPICFNGICKTIDRLEREMDEFAELNPNQEAKLNKLRRKIKVLI